MKMDLSHTLSWSLTICGLVLSLLVACDDEPDDEAQIRAVMNAMVEASEAGDSAGVVEYIAKDFKGSHNADRETVQQILLRETLVGGKIGVQRSDVVVKVEGASADVSFDAILSRRQKGVLVPQNIGAYHFDAKFAKRDDKWLVVGADYKKMAPKGLVP